MTKREERVVKAFLRCVETGEYTEEYAITLIEDSARYGWLSDKAKDYFYDHLPVEEEPEDISEEPIESDIVEDPTDNA